MTLAGEARHEAGGPTGASPERVRRGDRFSQYLGAIRDHLDEYRKGRISVGEISRRTGLPANQVRYALHRHGVRQDVKGYRPVDRDRLVLAREDIDQFLVHRLTIRGMAAKYGVSPVTVTCALRRQGVYKQDTRRRDRLTLTLRQCEQLRLREVTLTALARRAGCTVQTVRAAMIRQGVTIDPAPERREPCKPATSTTT